MESKAVEVEKTLAIEEKRAKKVIEEKKEMTQISINKKLETLETTTGIHCSIISGGVNYII